VQKGRAEAAPAPDLVRPAAPGELTPDRLRKLAHAPKGAAVEEDDLDDILDQVPDEDRAKFQKLRQVIQEQLSGVKVYSVGDEPEKAVGSGPIFHASYQGVDSMVPAVSYADVCSFIASKYGDFGWNDQPGPNPKVRMVGLLFAPPTEPLAKAEIVPALPDFHHRSGEHWDCFCAGYTKGWECEDYSQTEGEMVYSPSKFQAFRREIESLSSWRYEGDSELLLANACYDAVKRSGQIVFGSVIVCRLNAMKNDGAITSVRSFVEAIVRHTESFDGTDPTWGFSDKQGVKTGISWLKRLVLSLLPKDLGKLYQGASHFAVRDVSYKPA
jgi:hypothetical protein